jgi:hypothetical protein
VSRDPALAGIVDGGEVPRGGDDVGGAIEFDVRCKCEESLDGEVGESDVEGFFCVVGEGDCELGVACLADDDVA